MVVVIAFYPLVTMRPTMAKVSRVEVSFIWSFCITKSELYVNAIRGG